MSQQEAKKVTPFYCGLIVFSPDMKEILLAKRKEDGTWTGPGGGGDEGETPAEAAIREAFEEADLFVDPEWLEALPIREARDGKPIHTFIVVLPVKQETGVHNDPDHEVAKWKWHPVVQEIPQPMDPNRTAGIQAALMHTHERRKLMDLTAALEKPALEALEKGGHEKPMGTISPNGKYIKTAEGWKKREGLGHKPHSVTLHVENNGKRYNKTVHGVMAANPQHAIERMGRVVSGMRRNHPTMKVHRLQIHSPGKHPEAPPIPAHIEPSKDELEKSISELQEALRPGQTGFAQNFIDRLNEALEKGRPALPIGTIREWGGQKYVKHADGWIAVAGPHHGKRMGAFAGDVTHKDVADEHHPEKQAENLEAKAKALGAEAFKAGKKGVPAHDAALMKLLEGRPVGSSNEILDAWNKAWHEENRKAPVPEPEAPKEKESKKKPEKDTPRADAEEAQAEKDKADYEYARESEFGNKGEDLKGSARHKRNQWKGLEDAEKNGTAEALVKRDTLMREMPVDFLSAAGPKNYLGTMTAFLGLKKFPTAPKSVALSYFEKDPEDKVVKIKVRDRKSGTTSTIYPHQYENNQEKYDKLGEIKKKDVGQFLRKQYMDAFERMSKKADELKGESQPNKVVVEMRAECAKIIAELREEDRYSDMANTLVAYHNNALSPHKSRGNTVLADVGDFLRSAGLSSIQEAAERPEFIEQAKQVLEGTSIDKAFGKSKEKGFSAADAYVNIAKRKGPEHPELETKAGQEKALLDEMGMRGLQWGNSVTDDERKHHLKQVALAFEDLSDILGLPKEFCSFNDRLGLAIGARGKGTALAHYEPGNRVINLTRKGGVGSLAHEWLHAVDNILNETHSHSKTGFLSNYSESLGSHAGEGMPVVKALADMIGSPEWKAFRSRMRSAPSFGKLSPGKKDYWASTIEMLARSFEVHVQHKLKKKDRENTYLSGFSGGSEFWPSETEAAALAPHFDKFFEALKNSEHLKKAMELLGVALKAAAQDTV